MKIIRDVQEMQAFCLALTREGKRVAFVPTMGSLHDGHLSLIDVAKKLADIVVLSIFVNPSQFGPQEDLAQYPRNFEGDSALAAGRGVDILFHPGVEGMYPPGDQTIVEVGEITQGLCGASRPGHFRGVATVVAKLFGIVQPAVACFGEKDYQQLAVIRQMVRDLHLAVEIVGVPTLREPDGLAMSSRNVYLDIAARQEAALIYQAILSVQNLLTQGEVEVAVLLQAARQKLLSGGNIEIDYISIVDVNSLVAIKRVDSEARLIMAVHLGGKRLIDNAALVAE